MIAFQKYLIVTVLRLHGSLVFLLKLLVMTELISMEFVLQITKSILLLFVDLLVAPLAGRKANTTVASFSMSIPIACLLRGCPCHILQDSGMILIGS